LHRIYEIVTFRLHIAQTATMNSSFSPFSQLHYYVSDVLTPDFSGFLIFADIIPSLNAVDL